MILLLISEGCDKVELPNIYLDAEEWRHTLMLYDAALKEINTKLEILNNEFKLAHQYNPIEHITSRLKTPQSIAKKIRRHNKELTIDNIIKHINDVAGIRIICSFTSDIYRIAELISTLSDIKVLKTKDYIAKPKENGYKSYHMIVTIPVYLSNMTIDTKIEIQIRTIAMDFWASLEHKIYYKFEGNAPDYIQKELKECSELVSYLDQKMLSINEEVQSYSSQNGENFEKESYKQASIESFGTIVDEEENIEENKDELKKEKKEKKKSGRGGILLGFGL
jgi:putative GTP pyrophosphokinase